MSLTVVTKTTEGQGYTTTAALKQLALGATATSTVQDPELSLFIRRASRWANTFINQPLPNESLFAQTYRETVPAFGRRTLRLARTPVRAVLAVFYGTDTGLSATQVHTSEFVVEDAEAGLIARDQGFAWDAALQWRVGVATYGGDALPLDPAPMPGQEYRPWLVDYVAGWSYDGLSTASPNWSTEAGTTSTERSFPDDVEQGVLYKAQAYFDGGDEVQSEKLGDIETNYRSLGNDKDGRLITKSGLLLEPYQRYV